MTTVAEPAKAASVEVRCKSCKKLLAQVSVTHVYDIQIQIRCPRCNIVYDTIK